MRTAAFLMLATLTALVAGCGKKSGHQSGPERDSPQGGSDQDRLQGVWVIEKLDAGDVDRAHDAEIWKGFRFQFDGAKLITTATEQYKASFVLDTASNPKVMIVTRLDQEGRPAKRFASDEVDRSEWLYKFDGDALVLAITEGGKRPKDFVPRPSSGDPPFVTGTPGKGPDTVKDDKYVPSVSIIRLKKTDEAPPAPQKPRPGSKPTHGKK